MDSYERVFQNGIDLSVLPTCMHRGRVCIDWKNSVGCVIKIYKEYENGKIIDLTIVIERYDKKTRTVYFVGYKKGIRTSHLIKGKIGTIFTSITVTHPHTISYFLNPEDAYKYTSQSNKKVLLICPICGKTHEMVIQNFFNQGFTCPNKNCSNSRNCKQSEVQKGKLKSEEHKQKLSEARIGKYTGENNSNWQGGITPIKHHLRDIIDPFMEAHQKALNKTCELTGKNGEDSHHIYPFTNIVHDAHNKHNISIKPTVADYTPEELKALEDYVLSWHVIGDWSNMILLAEDVHKQVHNSEFYKNMQNKYDPNLTYEAAHKFIEEFKITWSSVAA